MKHYFALFLKKMNHIFQFLFILKRSVLFSLFFVFFCVDAIEESQILEQEITHQDFSEMLSKFSCEPYTPLSVSSEIYKSDVVLEIEKILAPRDVSFSPDWQTIQFRDISRNDSHFIAAQKLASIGIIPFEYFGNEAAKNPRMTKYDTEQILNKIFDQSKCGFVLNLDHDKDGIYNYNDTCPDIPARNTENGCPIFSIRPYEQKDSEGVFIEIPFQEITKLNFFEQTDIRLGDIFRAIIRNPDTGEILSESDTLEVKY
jgi:hypothetical protein